MPGTLDAARVMIDIDSTLVILRDERPCVAVVTTEPPSTAASIASKTAVILPLAEIVTDVAAPLNMALDRWVISSGALRAHHNNFASHLCLCGVDLKNNGLGDRWWWLDMLRWPNRLALGDVTHLKVRLKTCRMLSWNP